MGTNDPTNWQRRLAGETVPLSSTMEPDYGFYRVRTRDRTSWRPIAYWYDTAGKLVCRWGGGENIRMLTEEQAVKVWPAASENAITHELYKDICAGKPWPDLNNEVTRLTNNPPEEDTLESIQERIDDLVREAQRLMDKGGAKTPEQADQAADVANALAGLWTKADNLRKVQKQEYLDAGRAVDDKWRPLLTAAEVYGRLKQIVCAPWLAHLKRLKDEREAAARKAAMDADDAARKAVAEAAEKLAEANRNADTVALSHAQLAQEEAERQTRTANVAFQAAQDVASESVTVGTRGRGVHLRAEPVYEIADRAAMFAYLVSNAKAVAEIDAIMVKHARTLHRAGIQVPGLKVTNDSKAA